MHEGLHGGQHGVGGEVSGGCVEGAMLRRLKLREGAGVVPYDGGCKQLYGAL